jgi:aspartyl-tRNA(Asn)/glutamyl-tRNA(Gln) amidotransferase subunit B
MRCDANVSLRKPGEGFGTKVEIKNLNSIRSVGRALMFEIERQTKALNNGDTLVQETRHFDESSGVTKTLRSKEEAFDYRYFPEPDLVPVEPDASWIEALRSSLPELPTARRARLATDHSLTAEQAAIVGGSVDALKYFDDLLSAGVEPRDAAVWMAGELARALNTAGLGITEARVTPAGLAGLIKLVREEKINLNTAKKVFQDAFDAGTDPAALVSERGLEQVSDESALAAAIAKVLEANAAEVARFKAGEEKVLGFLMGQVMKELKGQGKPDAVKRLLGDALR